MKREKMRSLDNEINKRIEDKTKDLIFAIEKSKSVRVVSCSLQFTVSDDRSIWLTYSNNFFIANSKGTPKQTKPKISAKYNKIRDVYKIL